MLLKFIENILIIFLLAVPFCKFHSLLKYKSIIDLKVFNRWGSLVFETKDPQINWNGYDMQGNKLENAVYYYSCKIVPVSSFMNGETLKGFIEILGSTK